MDPETSLASAEVVAFLGLLPDLAEQAGQDRFVDRRVIDPRYLAFVVDRRAFLRLRLARLGLGRTPERQLQFAADQGQLAVGVAPLTQAQVVEEVLPAPAAQGIGTQRLALLLEATPEIDQRGEVGIRVLPLRVRLVGGLLPLHRTLARVLHGQRAGHRQHFLQATLLGRLQQHAAQPRVDRQARQLAPQRGQLAFAVDRRQFLQKGEAVLDRLAVRRLDEGERLDVAEAQVQHLQDHRGQVGAEDFRVGEGRTRVEVLLAVETHAYARLDPSATALALVGAGLRHRLDGQPLDLGAVAVAADPRGAAVDHVTDARHRQRGFRDVGGQHDLASRARLEDLLLLGRGQSRVQRQHLGVAQVGLAQHLRGVADLPLAGEEHQHVAGPLADLAFVGGDLVEGGEDALVHRQVVLDPVALLVGFRRQRPVPGLHRIGAAGNLDHRGAVEMPGETLQVDGRRGDDQLQVRTPVQQGLQVAEEEVDVQAALVGFVDDQRVVALQVAVMLGLGQEDAVGHQLDQGAVVALVLEAHLVADQRAQRRTDLFRDPRRHAARRQPTRLGMADQAVDAATQLQTDLRQLGGLARAGLAGDHHHLVGGDSGLDLVALGGDRQAVVVADRRHAGAPRLDLGAGGLEALDPLRQARVVGLLAQFVELPAQAVAVADLGLVEAPDELVKGRSLVGHLGFSNAVSVPQSRRTGEAPATAEAKNIRNCRRFEWKRTNPG